MKPIKLILAIVTLFAITANAQQLPTNNLYEFNKFQINSAYAGFNNCTEAYLSTRNQWVGIDGAPQTSYLSVHSGIYKNMGLGANLILDRTDIISKFSGSLAYSYKLKLGVDHLLQLGLSLGYYQVSIDFNNSIINDISDNLVDAGNRSGSTFSNDFSAFYAYKKLQVGISVPQIVETSTDFGSNNGSFSLKRHLVGYVGYDFNINDKVSLQPSILSKNFNTDFNQLDINVRATYSDRLYVGAGYRTGAGILARFGLRIKDLFTVAYAYELPTGDIGTVSSGSHEVLVGVRFCKNKKNNEIADPSTPTDEIQQESLAEQTTPETNKIDSSQTIKENTSKKTEESKPVAEPSSTEINKAIFDVVINFPLNNAENYDLSKNSSLNKMANELKTHPNLNIKIIGHACDRGNKEANHLISLKRADKVKQYLIGQNVSVDQITTEGMGASKPKFPNNSEANRAKNRRVEFVIEK